MKNVLIAILATGCLAAQAVGYNLETCMFDNGLPMHPKSCESLKQREVKVAADAKRYSELDAARRATREEQRVQAEAKEQDAKREREAKHATYLAEQEKLNEMGRKARQEQIDWERSTAKAAANQEAVLKQECGKDYKAISIGMPIERAQRCVANLKLTGQINRADAVVSTYESGRLYAHVIRGKIVSWGR